MVDLPTMYLNLLKTIQLHPIFKNFVFCKYRDDIHYFESKLANFAFDIIKSGDNILIDLVFRKKVNNKRKFFIDYQSLYNCTNNKFRLATLEGSINAQSIVAIIENKYLELTEHMLSTIEETRIDSTNKETLTDSTIKETSIDSVNKETRIYSVNSVNKELILNTNASAIPCFFYDKKLNFGDFVTPWLVGHFTGRPVINTLNHEQAENSIVGVGSIVGLLSNANQQNAKIWGSGLISAGNHNAIAERLHKNNLKKVYASRGELTKGFFKKNNFECNDILGDPALLFGSIYTPQPLKKYKYGIIPHYVHFNLFKKLNMEDCLLIDVKDDLTTVISQIANCEFCISTSLHGIIIAQSYNIPWARLNITDNTKIVGGDFKYNDFYSILNRDNVYEAHINSSDINESNLFSIFDKCFLPKFKENYSTNGLIDSFYECFNDN